MEQLEKLAASVNPRTKVVHCGVDTKRLQYRPLRRVASPPHLITVGRLIATKGHWTILEAAANLMSRDPALQWTIVGNGPLRDALAHDPHYAEFAPRICLAGAMDHDATLARVAEAAAFVLPCEEGTRGESDGIPVALMEAMALGVPVVTTHVGGIAELVVPDVTGFVVPPKDAPALTDTLTDLLYTASPAAIAHICDAARRKVERDFDLMAEANALIQFIQPYL